MQRFKNRAEKSVNWGDDMSLQELANGDGSLDMIHDKQYFQEDVSENNWGGLLTVHRTFNVPVPLTLTGTIYLKGEVAGVFHMDKDRKIVLFDTINVPDHPTKLVSGQGYDTGILVMNWSQPVEAHEVRLVMGYEYDICDDYNEMHFNT